MSKTTTLGAEAPRRRVRNPLTRSRNGGRALNALMLPGFTMRSPRGFGVLTTTGRRTKKARSACVRVARQGDKAYLVMLAPAVLAKPRTDAVSAWLWNIRGDPRVRIRLGGQRYAGVARELLDGDEIEQARRAYCQNINMFDYLECIFHARGWPTTAKIKQLHKYWFDAGIPLVVDVLA
jgi:deazaflavin-dependent oxidoreductase (nitroreductase family)